MHINKIHIKNYRNLDDFGICLNTGINFLVGETNLGKSNFLDLLYIVFVKGMFLPEDFCNEDYPIEIHLSLDFSDIELGCFEDYFDPNNSNSINIIAKQNAIDDPIRYYHEESLEEISIKKIRVLNYLRYDSLRTPKEELSFYGRKGVSRFLQFLVSQYLENNKEKVGAIVDKTAVGPIVAQINSTLNKIKVFNEFMINVDVEEELSDLISRMLSIKDSNSFDIQKTGHGLQFAALIFLSILEGLMCLIEDKRKKDYIFTYENKSYVSLVLGLDEPEIHLHPYMQRSLITSICDLIENKDPSFSSLIKELYNIDRINGQSIVVSHSPNILLNDYKQISRLYIHEKRVKVVSGATIHLNGRTEKHLLRNFIYIKEAFFSRCVIIAEGEREFAALPLWSRKLNIDLDGQGISIIHAGGTRSVPYVSELLNSFKIPNISIIDRDTYMLNNTSYNNVAGLFITNKLDFEEELFEHLYAAGNIQLLFDILKEYEPVGLEKRIQAKSLEEMANRYSTPITWANNDYKFSDIENSQDANLIKTMFLAWLKHDKSIILGRVIGDNAESTTIPTIYKDVLVKADSLAKQHGPNH